MRFRTCRTVLPACDPPGLAEDRHDLVDVGQIVGCRNPVASCGVGANLLGGGRPGDDGRTSWLSCQSANRDLEHRGPMLLGPVSQGLNLVEFLLGDVVGAVGEPCALRRCLATPNL